MAGERPSLLLCDAEDRTLLAQVVTTVVLGFDVDVEVLRWTVLLFADVVHRQVELIRLHHLVRIRIALISNGAAFDVVLSRGDNVVEVAADTASNGPDAEHVFLEGWVSAHHCQTVELLRVQN